MLFKCKKTRCFTSAAQKPRLRVVKQPHSTTEGVIVTPGQASARFLAKDLGTLSCIWL